MIDNIKNAISNLGGKVSEKAQQEPDKVKKEMSVTSEHVPASKSEVEFSQEAKRLEGLSQRIMNFPEVDDSRVAEIKEAIAKGDYKVNYENLAKSLLSNNMVVED